MDTGDADGGETWLVAEEWHVTLLVRPDIPRGELFVVQELIGLLLRSELTRWERDVGEFGGWRLELSR